MKLPKPPRWAIALAAIGVAGAGAILYASREKPPEIRTAAVVRGDLEATISAAGKVQPKHYVDVGAQVSGQLKTFLVEVGERVARGQLLAEIDETLAAAKVEQGRAQLRELKASSDQQQASLELARANAERANMLRQADAISEAQAQAARADLKIAEARLEQLRAQISRAESTLAADLASLEFTKIYAPMDGTVVSQSAVVGQTLNASQTAPTILRIADLSVMTVEADVSEADVLRVQTGQEAYFATLGDLDRRWRTNVRQVLPQPEVLNDVVLYKVLLDIDNPAGLLKPEMTAQVFFVTGRAREAVLAPVAALQDAPQRRASERPNRPVGERGAERRRDERPQPAQTNLPEGATSARAERRGLMTASASELPAGTGAAQAGRADIDAVREARPDAQLKIVQVMTKNGPVSRPVLVGVMTRAQAEILHGLEPGDIVVTGQSSPQPLQTQRAGAPGQPMAPAGMGRRGPRG